MSRGQICLMLSAIAAAVVACGTRSVHGAPARAGRPRCGGRRKRHQRRTADASGGPTTATGSGGTAGADTAGKGAVGPFTFTPGPCADVFSDDQLTTYELQINATEWAALVDDFNSMQANRAADLDYHPYHKVDEFKYGDEVLHNVLIRLKGWSSWWQAQADNPPKMQFVSRSTGSTATSASTACARSSWTCRASIQSYLRQRVALSYLRALGVPAECANSGRLFINGALYGLYTNLERPDEEFITRIFPGEDRGELWDGAWQSAIHQDEMGFRTRASTRSGGQDPVAIAAIADMDEALLEWASEAMLADADGYWIGHFNFFVYDHPTRGWLWLPHDLDAAINWIDPHIDPMYYWGGDPGWSPPWQHYIARAQGLRVARALRGGASPQLRRLRGGEPSRDGRSFRRADPRHGRRRSDAPFRVRHLPERGRLPAPVDHHARRRESAPGWIAAPHPTRRPTPTAITIRSAWTARTPTRRCTPAPPRSAATGSIRTATASTSPPASSAAFARLTSARRP